ncbi:MAG: hypothetical protein P1U86_11605 [Verrucomicrobiales bacterium]|nr:hypothetical protein [Verrucomicrobiales bacterium]
MAAKALESLCREYRAPILAFIERTGLSKIEAEDAVQDFLLKFIRSGGFTNVKQSGRARNYILKSVQYFLIDRHRSENAEKRDRSKTESIEEDDIEASFEPVLEIFDREWAQRIMDAAVRKVQEFFASQNKEAFGEALFGIIEGRNDNPEMRSAICETFEITENHLAVAATRFQMRLKKEIRELVANTVSNPEEIEDELRYLRNVMAETMKADQPASLPPSET